MKHITSYFIPELIDHYQDMIVSNSLQEYLDKFFKKQGNDILDYTHSVGPKQARVVQAFFEDKVYNKVECLFTQVGPKVTTGLNELWDIVIAKPYSHGSDDSLYTKLFFARWKQDWPVSEFVFDPDMENFYPHWYTLQRDDDGAFLNVSTVDGFEYYFNQHQLLIGNGKTFKDFKEKEIAALKKHFDKWGNRINFIWGLLYENGEDLNSNHSCSHIFTKSFDNYLLVAVVK